MTTEKQVIEDPAQENTRTGKVLQVEYRPVTDENRWRCKPLVRILWLPDTSHNGGYVYGVIKEAAPDKLLRVTITDSNVLKYPVGTLLQVYAEKVLVETTVYEIGNQMILV